MIGRRIGAVCLVFAGIVPAAAQSGVPLRSMLREAYNLVKKEYYDPAYHGVDWDARFQEFDARMRAASAVNAGLGVIAEFLSALKDSHTYFLPPSRPFEHDYGYRLRIIGEKTYIASVIAGTDAAGKVAPGDEVISMNGFVPSRETLFTVEYILNALAPLESIELVLRNPAGSVRKLVVNARITEKPKRNIDREPWAIYRTKDTRTPHRLVSLGDVLVWSMPDFVAEDRDLDGVWGRARQHRAVILDLRGNGGGYVTAMKRMVANVLNRDVTVYNRVTRKGSLPESVKSRKDDVFGGELVVLVDSWSASAAELFARIVQIERRGTVIGDRTAGAVMQARYFEGESRQLDYGFLVTDANLIMLDGKSLENTGVVPDQTILPAAADLAAGRDPVLSQAARRLGLDLDPVAAGKLYDKK